MHWRKGMSVLNKTMYFNTSRFFDLAKLAKLDGTYHRLIKKIQTTELFILDDFGLATIDQASRNVLMDVVEERHEKSSIIIATQIPVANWHGLIGESTIADAILDRIVFSSHRIELEGESLRKNKQLST
jgi:DNA replication protein DnaC